jgi:hypothetical protein
MRDQRCLWPELSLYPVDDGNLLTQTSSIYKPILHSEMAAPMT